MDIRFVIEVNETQAQFESLSTATTAAKGALMVLGLSDGYSLITVVQSETGQAVYLATMEDENGEIVQADTGILIRSVLC